MNARLQFSFRFLLLLVTACGVLASFYGRVLRVAAAKDRIQAAIAAMDGRSSFHYDKVAGRDIVSIELSCKSRSDNSNSQINAVAESLANLKTNTKVWLLLRHVHSDVTFAKQIIDRLNPDEMNVVAANLNIAQVNSLIGNVRLDSLSFQDICIDIGVAEKRPIAYHAQLLHIDCGSPNAVEMISQIAPESDCRTISLARVQCDRLAEIAWPPAMKHLRIHGEVATASQLCQLCRSASAATVEVELYYMDPDEVHQVKAAHPGNLILRVIRTYRDDQSY